VTPSPTPTPTPTPTPSLSSSVALVQQASESSNSGGGSALTFTANSPVLITTPISVGDLLTLEVYVGFVTAYSISTPTGWTAFINNSSTSLSNYNGESAIFYKVATSADVRSVCGELRDGRA
jgi:hypothetical protein